jgi:hypothetical protein
MIQWLLVQKTNNARQHHHHNLYADGFFSIALPIECGLFPIVTPPLPEKRLEKIFCKT